MDDKKMFRTGIFGSAFAAVCCFTPLLVVLFGAVGVSAWLGWIDYVLFPALFVFLGVTAFAQYRCAGRRGGNPLVVIVPAVIAFSYAVLGAGYVLVPVLVAVAAVAGYGIALRRGAPGDSPPLDAGTQP